MNCNPYTLQNLYFSIIRFVDNLLNDSHVFILLRQDMGDECFGKLDPVRFVFY